MIIYDLELPIHSKPLNGPAIDEWNNQGDKAVEAIEQFIEYLKEY